MGVSHYDESYLEREVLGLALERRSADEHLEYQTRIRPHVAGLVHAVPLADEKEYGRNAGVLKTNLQ